MVSSAMSASSKPIPIALPNELLDQIDLIAEKLNLTRAELMRLSMRIGLVEIGTIAEPIAQLVAREAAQIGISFAHFVNEKLPTPTLEKNNACADNAPSKSPSLPSPAVKTSTANIVRLPMPPTLKTVIHDSLKVGESPTPYVATKRKRKVGEG